MRQRIINAIRNMRFRKAPLWHQRDLAREIGSTQSDVSAYELGKVIPGLEKAIDIANALGQPVQAVFHQLNEESIRRIGARRRRRQQSGAEPPCSYEPNNEEE